jgi:predicted Zn-dependent protease
MNRVVARVPLAIALVAFSVCAGDAASKPYVPQDDAAVLERLPERGDAALRDLKRMRAALAATPRDLDYAAAVAQRAIEAARETGDPRFLGQAQAALRPWWTAADPPARALLLRATVKQSQHDFEGALADLDRILAQEPANGQALLTRATVLTVTGEYGKARRDCARLARLASPLVVTACLASPSSLTGEAPSAYRALVSALARSGEDPAVQLWGLTLAAEIAARRGDAAGAERHFRNALAFDARDPYLRGAYADFLLDQGRPRDVLPLVRDDLQNDALLLRLALAEQALPEVRAAFEAHRQELAARFDAARARGDALHRREEARFRLALADDPRGALALARDNWAVQREAADLRILAAAAHAAGDRDARQIVDAWIAANRLEDAALVVLREARR